MSQSFKEHDKCVNVYFEACFFFKYYFLTYIKKKFKILKDLKNAVFTADKPFGG